MLKTISHLRNRHFLIIDILLFMCTPMLALMLRLDTYIFWDRFGYSLLILTISFTLVKVIVFYFSGFYRRYWKHASIDELGQLIVISILTFFINFLFFRLMRIFPILKMDVFPRSIPYLDGLISIVLIGFTRMTVRLALRYQERGSNIDSERTLIVGAGHAGISLVMDMQHNPNSGYNPVAFIDDDKKKIGLRVRGIDIVGNRKNIKEVIIKHQISRIVVAIPSASGRDIRKIIEDFRDTGLKVQTLPSISEIMNGNVQVKNIREVNIIDLLRREPIDTDINEVVKFINNKKVLITGAGGSIGSEICRQVFKFGPSQLIILGHGENSIFDITNELKRLEKNSDEINIKIIPIIADVRFTNRLQSVFHKYKPDIVFHAAAHKHVLLMEENPVEAITNNIIGTQNLLDCADRAGVDNFVMISTDKAVNPTSIMGASKRAAEMLVMKKAGENKKAYVCVRFGNVLGSRGSVVPIFKKQIEKGGPVIVTHPDVKRYFMTIPEAVQLVLQASIIGSGGEIFVLDMGKPIKIVDMAKDMIRLSGYKDFEIPIIYCGLRQGEKLFEELFVKGEKYEPTKHKKILIAANASQFIPDNIDNFIESFKHGASMENDDNIKKVFKKMIPEFEIQ